MNRLLVVVVCAAAWAAGGVFAGRAAAGPRTGLVPKSWELEFEFDDPQRMTIKPPGSNEPQTYWYMVYRVTNRTGQDVEFLPSFRLVTDTLQVRDAGDNVNPMVYDYIAARHKSAFPFFDSPYKITGKLLQGQENARCSAAVFQPFDANASSFKIYVGGLSGEMLRQPNRSFDPGRPESEDENPRFFLLRRSLEITYDLPGDPETRNFATPIRRNRAWVLR